MEFLHTSWSGGRQKRYRQAEELGALLLELSRHSLDLQLLLVSYWHSDGAASIPAVRSEDHRS